ncbi:MAG: GIY-YIG nuclease family protein [Micavibrio sp.]|jgi:putative endonuclease|nr:GIY-YIG nuclease family protein [Micavibrio sp.]MBK9561708.1 GIY-YIG nuclease family protein [Micavibrio sp.]
MKKKFCVYILTNKMYGTLYVGMTSSLPKRIWEHKNKIVEGFSQKYDLDKLVYYEVHENAESAIKREKRLKKWDRKWKIELIQKQNPDWQDLFETIAS